MTSIADAAALTSAPADLDLDGAAPPKAEGAGGEVDGAEVDGGEVDGAEADGGEADGAEGDGGEAGNSAPGDVDVAVSAMTSADWTGSAAAQSAGAHVFSMGPLTAARPSAADAWSTRALQSPLVRAVRAQTLTAPAGLILAAALLVPGVLVDLFTDATAGRPTAISFLLAAGIPPLVVRRNALGTAVVAPPVLFASALLVFAWGSGQNETNRQVVLDAGTSLALTAPHLFAGTVVAVVLVLARLSWGLVHRA